ncbi:CGNR zinc finger domain-containing protein [Kutzneria buriramensis]|uniref:Putative RNA-binding Zn ribbon-like protein n=1 Tax=Kutzneria buriramensis TaxID=1045776 RepID=A0A3E0HLI7_9PSEU|nr:CGNR zinc finger domain-containing protein [Kutzneria buriramensis]REH47220.1 putative RNA-binding Zn ribbon-like protein [Kutzneria buriramensis]
MDNAAYLDVALRLANADLTEVDGLREALYEEPWWADRVDENDLRALRAVADGLRRVLADAVGADREGVTRDANALLAAHPLRPQLSSGHDEKENWHVHVADPGQPPATEVAAAAAWGVAQGIVHYGLERWGRCAAEDCGKFFLDTSTNRAKRFCSARCANRVHVAAFRSRRRD